MEEPAVAVAANRDDAMLRERFGKRVRELRKSKGMSLEVLGGKAGIDDKYVQSLETAKKAATLDTIEKLANGLRVQPVDLFTYSDEKPVEARLRVIAMISKVNDGDVSRIARVLQALVGG